MQKENILLKVLIELISKNWSKLRAVTRRNKSSFLLPLVKADWLPKVTFFCFCFYYICSSLCKSAPMPPMENENKLFPLKQYLLGWTQRLLIYFYSMFIKINRKCFFFLQKWKMYCLTRTQKMHMYNFFFCTTTKIKNIAMLSFLRLNSKCFCFDELLSKLFQKKFFSGFLFHT